MANTVTIKIKPVTKALMEIYGSAITQRRGSSPTNDEIIQDALTRLLPEEAVKKILKDTGNPRKQDAEEE